jgi:deoxyribonuclease V
LLNRFESRFRMDAMKAAMDVSYQGEATAHAACVVFEDWADSVPATFFRAPLTLPKPYRPGRFFERELPCLLALLQRIDRRFEAIVIDGYVHLRQDVGKGLGVHLYESLNCSTLIVGVAKNPLAMADQFIPVYRGRSGKPLFVSAIGCSAEQAALYIASMHGPYRIPTLLKLADRCARTGEYEQR